jgi:hypothetical protein
MHFSLKMIMMVWRDSVDGLSRCPPILVDGQGGGGMIEDAK